MSYGLTTSLETASRVLNDGGVIGMPTETVYGLAARSDFEESVGRIFDIKGRPRNHPLIAHLSPEANPHLFGHFNDNAQRLADAFWPGPLTLLVPKSERIGMWVTGGRDTVALRVPALQITQQLLSRIDVPVVAPSANRFGKVSPTTAQHVMDDLGDAVDCVLDGGQCSIGVESTIVECVGANVALLRPGGVTATQIADVVGLAPQLTEGESRAPGMMISHYAPNARVVLVQSLDEAYSVASTNEFRGQRSEIMHYKDPADYALNMYDQLRLYDAQGIGVVLAVLPQPGGIGDAVIDRLLKAAAPKN